MRDSHEGGYGRLCFVMTGKAYFNHRIKALMLERHIIKRGLINCDKARVCGIIIIAHWQGGIRERGILAGNIMGHRMAMRQGGIVCLQR